MIKKCACKGKPFKFKLVIMEHTTNLFRSLLESVLQQQVQEKQPRDDINGVWYNLSTNSRPEPSLPSRNRGIIRAGRWPNHLNGGIVEIVAFSKRVGSLGLGAEVLESVSTNAEGDSLSTSATNYS